MSCYKHNLKSKMKQLVLGGGIGGLSSAFYLRKRFPNAAITIIEATARTGGWIKSSQQAEGYIFEQGPRTIRLQGGLNTLNLFDELKLGSSVKPILRNHPAALNRMIYVNGQLHTLPSSFWSLFKTVSPFSKPLVRYILNDLKAPVKVIQNKDESIYNFVERRFGKEIADYAISPLICGICAGNAKEISVKFLMGKLFEYEQTFGNIAKGILYNTLVRRNKKPELIESELAKKAKKEKWSLYSLSNGLESLPIKLTQVLKEDDVDILLDTPVSAVELDKDGAIVHITKGDKIKTNHLFSCVPAYIFGNLVVGHTKFKQLLQSFKGVDVCVINLHFNKKILSKDGFGCLIPPVENLPILGIIFDSCCFPHGDDTVLTVMMGGHWFNKHFGNSPAEADLLETALNQIQNILGIREKPDKYKINILKNCIPQYVIGHTDKVYQLKEYIRENKLPLSLCGASYHGVGINDVITTSKNAVDELRLHH